MPLTIIANNKRFLVASVFKDTANHYVLQVHWTGPQRKAI